MPNRLLSGPAGAGKTQEARRLLELSTAPLVVADFQSILAALLLLERGQDGRYPPRNPSETWALPLAEYTRQAIITGAAAMEIELITTTSDGAAARRNTLLSRLGPGATETIIDPGIDVVTGRLAGPDGELSEQCQEAVGRWYGRR